MNTSLAIAALNTPYGLAYNQLDGRIYVVDYTGHYFHAISTGSGGVPSPVCDGRWHNVVNTFGGGGLTGTAQTYVDGIPVGQPLPLAVASAASAGPLYMGYSGDSSAPLSYTGALADVRVWARALAPSEALALSFPFLPQYFTGVVVPTPSLGALSYLYQCAPGYAGTAVSYVQNPADSSWAISGAVSCSICPVNTYAAVALSSGNQACVACSVVDPNAIAVSAGSASCTCPVNFYSNGLSLGLLTCAACPAGSTAIGAPTSCVCGPNFIALGSAASLDCICPSGYTLSGSGSSTLCTPAAGVSNAFAAGNLLVLRVGDGGAPLTSSTAAIFLDEYQPTGVKVQSVATGLAASGTDVSVASLLALRQRPVPHLCGHLSCSADSRGRLRTLFRRHCLACHRPRRRDRQG